MAVKFGALASSNDWADLRSSLAARPSPCLTDLTDTFRAAGAKSFLIETQYIDRDFSSSHSEFYSSLFRPYQKYCRRVHFFASDLATPLGQKTSPEEVVEAVAGVSDDYLGFVVLRPIEIAPVSWAVVAQGKFCSANPQSEIPVHASYSVHVLGVELKVTGAPITQQDTRIGSCAQAAIWSVGRHFHTKHGGPWSSLPDITKSALIPTDAAVSMSLPAGSRFLTTDHMARALRAMDRHPLRYEVSGTSANARTHQIINRYLDSGIPVILALSSSTKPIGHAVVAVGRKYVTNPVLSGIKRPTTAEGTSHFYVLDDQRGAYRELPASNANRAANYEWTLDDCSEIIVPVPSKVFMPGEIAETMSWNALKSVINSRSATLSARGLDPIDQSQLDADFEQIAIADECVARTYLTFGWKYRARMLRNSVPSSFKRQLLQLPLPRYVWVTEFSKPSESFDQDHCRRRVHAHCVLDATGGQYFDSVLAIHVPGMIQVWNYELDPARSKAIIDRAEPDAFYWPKVRGWSDYQYCRVI